MADDFEVQIKLEKQEQEKKELAATASDPYVYTDPKDGTVYDWNHEKQAWFPRVDDDFIARYQQASYNYQIPEEELKKMEEEKQASSSAEPKETKEKGVKRKPNDPTSSISMPSPRSRGLDCPKYDRIVPKTTKTKSPVWRFFGLPADKEGQIITEEVTICMLCKFPSSSRGGSTSNLLAHLKTYHPIEYVTIKKSTEPTTATAPSTSSSAPSNVADLSSLSDDDKEAMRSFEAPPAKKSKTLPEFTPISAFEEACTSAVAKFIATAMLPYSMVEYPPFMQMLEAMNPQYELPGRKYFSEIAVPEMYIETKEKLRKLMASVESNQISITTDSWTSLNAIPFIAITAHFVNEWKMESLCLSCFSLVEDHTAENIEEILQEKLSEWNVDSKEVCSCTTDNGANIVRAMDSLNLPRVPCFGHVVNIGMNSAMKLPDLERALSKLKRLQNTIANSRKLADLGNVQRLMKMEVKMLPSACPTNWGSTLKLCKIFLENQIPICNVLRDYPSKRHLLLDSNEICAIETFVECTKLLNEITKKLAGEIYVTGSSVIPLLRKIKKSFETKEEDSNLTKSIKSEIASVLEKWYYNVPELMDTLTLSTVCDPRFRSTYTLDKGKAEKLILEAMIEFNFGSENTASGSTVKKRVKYGLEEILDSEDDIEEEELAMSLPSKKAEIELKNYLSMPKVPLNNSPLKWWKSYAQSFPYIEALAKKYLAVQGTSVPLERVFSSSGNVIAKNRTSLLPKNAEMLVFLSENKNYI